MIVFGAQSKAPKEEYLSRLQKYLSQHPDLALFKDEVLNLPETWFLFTSRIQSFETLQHSLLCLEALSEWMAKGTTNWISKSIYGTLTIPLLMIIELVQYFQFLQEANITHRDVVTTVGKGAGIQGYCAGLLTGCCVAVAADEAELVRYACKMLRLAVGIGAGGDLGGFDVSTGPTTTVLIRLTREDQLDEITQEFPNVSKLVHTGTLRLMF